MTDTKFPDPLVPAEVDLKDFDFIPFEFRRLFASETWILATHEEKCAAFCLWCESWHQAPAGSLPDNDRVLAHLSQSGLRWPKLRAHALRGWQKCSDGLLYHPVVAEKVLEAWAKHRKASSKGKAGASKRWGTGSPSAIRSDSTGIGNNGAGIASATKNHAMEVEVNRKEGGNRDSPTRSIERQNLLKHPPQTEATPESIAREKRVAALLLQGKIDEAKKLKAELA